MPIQQSTPQAEIEAYLTRKTDAVRRAAVRILSYVGERCVEQARSQGSYTDRTGNLRSSVGYVVAVDGKVTEAGQFSGNGAEGTKEGEAFARRLAAAAPHGLCLIVVAGMHYARYVEDRGYDVITSAELLARRLVPQMLKQLRTPPQ